MLIANGKSLETQAAKIPAGKAPLKITRQNYKTNKETSHHEQEASPKKQRGRRARVCKTWVQVAFLPLPGVCRILQAWSLAKKHISFLWVVGQLKGIRKIKNMQHELKKKVTIVTVHSLLPKASAVPRSQGKMSQKRRNYLMLMANSAASFTLCRTKNVPSERLVRMLSAPARSMGPAYLSRYTKERRLPY